MASGVKIQQEAVDEFNKLKINKTYRYLVLGFVNNKTEVGILNYGDRDLKFDDLVGELKQAAADGAGRYAVFDYEYKTKDNRDSDQLVLISWAPDSISAKERLLVASSHDEVCKTLSGVVKWQVNDPDDLEEQEMLSIVRSK